MQRREFIAAFAGVLAGCLSGEEGESVDPTEEFEIESSLGSNEPIEVTENRSFETEGDETVVREEGSARRIDTEDWERVLCRDTALVALRSALKASVDIDTYSYIVPSFGEVSGRVLEGYRGRSEELAEYGVEEGDEVLMVQHVSVIGDDGSVVRSPALGYGELVDATPSSVRVSVVSDGGSERVVNCPVLVWKTAQLA